MKLRSHRHAVLGNPTRRDVLHVLGHLLVWSAVAFSFIVLFSAVFTAGRAQAEPSALPENLNATVERAVQNVVNAATLAYEENRPR